MKCGKCTNYTPTIEVKTSSLYNFEAAMQGFTVVFFAGSRSGVESLWKDSYKIAKIIELQNSVFSRVSRLPDPQEEKAWEQALFVIQWSLRTFASM